MIKISPEDSRDHQYIRSLATDIGVQELSIRKMLFFLNAPGYLVSFVRIMENLHAGLHTFTQKYDVVFEQDTVIYEIYVISKYLTMHRYDLVQQIGEHVVKGEKGSQNSAQPPTYGFLVHHAMYCSWWHTHDDLDYQNRYKLLQVHTYFACAKSMQSKSSLDEYECFDVEKKLLKQYNSSLSAAGRKLRSLSSMVCASELEFMFHGGLDSATHQSQKDIQSVQAFFVHRIIRLNDEITSPHMHATTNCFALLFKQAYKGKKASIRQCEERTAKRARHGYHSLGESMLSHTTIPDDVQDLDYHVGTQRLIQKFNDQEENRKLDNAPTENNIGTELYLTEYDGDLASFLSRLFAAKGQIRHIVMRNQMLRTSWSQMTTWEVAHLMRVCSEKWRSLEPELSESNNMDAQNRIRMGLESIALIMIMLWTGKSLEEATEIVVGNQEDVGHAALAFIQDSNQWRLLPYMITEKTLPSQIAIQMSLAREAYVYLPSVINVGHFFKVLQEHSINTSASFFRSSVKAYSSAIKQLLLTLPKGHRVTIPKVETYIFHLIATEGAADVTDAMITTSSYHTLGQTPLHYTTPAVADIQQRYEKTVRSVVTDVHQEAIPRQVQFFDFTRDHDSKHLGSRLCPTTTSIIGLADYLREKIGTTPEDLTVENCITYHNYYTIYANLMIGYATGYRAVRNPFFSRDDIDEATGLAIISDKDDESCYNTRVVWIPDLIQQQMKNYTKHLKLLKRFAKKMNLDCHWSDSTPMFLLSDNFKSKELRPKNILPYIESAFPFPLNVNRRYLRTTLKQSGCPTEVINAFMGHWQMGEEPWGIHSTLSMMAYRAALKEHLEPLLEKLSWRTVDSKLL